MPLDLAQPGQMVRKTLGEDGFDDVVAVFSAPDDAVGRELIAIGIEFDKQPQTLHKLARRALGLCLEGLEGVTCGGEEIDIQKTGGGELKRETMGQIVQLVPSLFRLALSMTHLTRADAKNY